jgi:hypothetical protein
MTKHDSTDELTAVCAAPASTIPGPTIEQLADLERARRDAAMERDTLMPCPMCRAATVTPLQQEYWLARYPELAANEPPPSQPEVP